MYNVVVVKCEIMIWYLLIYILGIGYGVIDGDECFCMIYEKVGIIDLFMMEDIIIEESVKKLV